MKKLFSFAAVLFLSFSVFAAYNRFGIPDSSEIRSGLGEEWFFAPLSAVRNNIPQIRVNPNGEYFQIYLEEADDTFQIYVSPRTEITVEVYTDSGIHREKQLIYPGEAKGGFLLVRDKKNGEPIKIRYYFLADSDVYIQFTPNGKMALADLVVFGNYAARGVPTGMPFEKFYSASFEDVYKITQTKLPWEYVLIDTDLYSNVKQMIAVIRKCIPNIELTPDAVYDENEKLVHIVSGKAFEDVDEKSETLYLSNPGFAKWIADGLVEPVSNGLIKLTPLFQETVQVKENGYQGVLSQKANLYFSLDWIRNLSSAVISAFSGSTYMFNQSGVNVTVNPFASKITEKGVSNTVTFIEDTGYTVSVLKSLMYVLAATEPNTFYFGAIRETDRTVTPEVKVFNECVVFFPYFNDNGAFACSVFIKGKEISINDFCLFYAGDFVYLTRVKASERFFPKGSEAFLTDN